MFRHFVMTTLFALACLLAPPLPALAQDELAGLCPLFLHQQQTELEDLELEVGLEETRLDVAQDLFVLIDDLWSNQIVERLLYVGVKHRRDAAEASLERARAQLARQQAVVDQYRLACGAPATEEQTAEDRRALEEAYQRYLEADCEVRTLDVTVFEVDLAYYQEVLNSARDLRQSDIASRQQVLFAQEDVEVTQKQLEQARQRVARCQQ